MMSRINIITISGFLVTIALFVVVLLSSGFSFRMDASPEFYDKIRYHGELRVLTRNAPTTLYQGRDGSAGLEFDLVSDFAEYLGVTPVFIIKANIGEILDGLANGEGAIAAAGLTKTAKRAEYYEFGPAYQRVEQQLVCRRGGKIPKNIAELASVKIQVAAHSSYSDSLVAFREQHPEITWQETVDYDTEQLLRRVWFKEIDCTIADSNIVAINRRYFPELVVALTLGEEQPLAWLLSRDAGELENALYNWFGEYESSGKLATTLERNFGYVELFDYVDLQRFRKRIKSRLPHYKRWFVQAANKHELSWSLLAAQSYQESHWRRKAKSPTGVRGIMMLTLATARELGIRSRLNAKASIFGGARYLASLRKRLPDTIPEPDRTWFALAAYNVGIGHIYDARELALRHDLDPDRWISIEEMLPLLSQRDYFEDLQYGYARGSEPVRYVKQIRHYQDILDNTLGAK